MSMVLQAFACALQGAADGCLFGELSSILVAAAGKLGRAVQLDERFFACGGGFGIITEQIVSNLIAEMLDGAQLLYSVFSSGVHNVNHSLLCSLQSFLAQRI
ncbi:hypothetical protein [Paenibacillus plantiphilus]|uniref:hypothetical protein n=1 Tax=Paenibacillus plantiphilus TaxID=2905650 RepID=UPI001F4781AF|nr:hypothetical protein [Paenibacillus plantiphilus]